jgi:hypothetical protein
MIIALFSATINNNNNNNNDRIIVDLVIFLLNIFENSNGVPTIDR